MANSWVQIAELAGVLRQAEHKALHGRVAGRIEGIVRW